MKARYIGDPRTEDGPHRVRFAGKSFPRDVFVDISDLSELLQTKLAGNKYFEVAEGDITAADEAALAAADSRFAPAGDGDDEAEDDAAAPADKEKLLDALDALAAKHPDEVKFNRTWGVKKLAQALEDAKFAIGEDD